MNALSNFKESLAELMLERGLTHISLGNAIGVANSNIHGWKTGKHSLKLSTAIKLAEYFECSLEFLLGRTEIRLNFTPQKCPPFYERLLYIMKENKISHIELPKAHYPEVIFRYGKKAPTPLLTPYLTLPLILIAH